ncbi:MULTISPECIES: HlyD family efflux transporter periplasmic adaptor subunit [Aneurinibacillus]|uniref:HlyD family efflux transporter periplasmic adaptor subunit n=1 Tax=Aneurinibacillus thermoaerophilus TaxID=143495 RepID=A0A1G8AIL4_ANETH|nr:MULTISPECIES: HlyD family efflux transporter periplasmic adaptor subunit [Aneurinibacillus]AMA71517.1 hemolysin D [Aneurinibacillus sp. XH2]MED0675297.1 HlyD family efflux transporter periplasmic adaptor subunit [Aneurinibacillus thermoaerophilus]MED0678589.1 HlyD family efflux transporter periplasmic adaptor subunit [Aneurinibacillus thermoaerophilus]MED0738322.1 HlyD family efflux transporter periplasmic adaptor subunit [Aneurinibacillus thermoaerophilus]MED0756543.1 HlyD family efflux tr
MKRKMLLWILLLAMLISGGGIGYYYWYQGTHYVKTEDARIQGDQYRIMPQIAGEIMRIHVEEGDVVQENDAIAEQDPANMDPSMVSRSVLRAPISGVVVKVFAKEHEMGAPGQPVAVMMDFKHLYVSANIEETDISKIHPGQKVDITLDAANGKTITGKVRKIGKASNSTFALIPATNASGNFNKVTQRIPVEISIDKPDAVELIPGTNVEIKVHIT